MTYKTQEYQILKNGLLTTLSSVEFLPIEKCSSFPPSTPGLAFGEATVVLTTTLSILSETH